MRKILFYILLILAVVVNILYFTGHKQTKELINSIIYNTIEFTKGIIGNRTFAITKARSLMDETISDGRDLSSGPCLAEKILFNWSVDIVHVPRTEIDNLVENQCWNYNNGSTKYLIEFDESGNLLTK